MKNFLIMIAGSLAVTTFGQCTITGNTNLTPNETSTFTVDAKAQCDECYSWKSSTDKTLKIEGNHKSNKIDVKSSQVGKGTISVSVFTNEGLVT